ncbi:MAG TPA: proprotein convertase P-domain-containing protein, partial [Nocardioides sp.]|nr:proprotein convertase P-domain-containing protein [Nocardioides sp.]
MYRRRIGLVSGVLLALVSPLWPAAAPASAALSAVAPAPVSLPATPGSETLDNNTAATATPIQSGARIRGEIDVKGDVDYYAFTAPADSRVYAAVITAGSNPSRDSVLWVIDTDGTTVLEADDDNGSLRNLSSSIAGTRLTDAGTYYLQVESLSAGGIFVLKPYDVYLQVQGGASDAENEPNDTQDRPTPIGDMLMTGVRSATPPVGQPDADFYSLDLAPGDTIFASLDLDPERDGVAWNGRLQFGPFGDDTTALQPADDPGTADAIPSEAYAMTVDRSGTFYAVVDAASADVGGPTATYGLSVTVIRAAAVSCRAYSATAGGQITDKGLTSFEIEVSDAARVGRVALDVDLTHPRMTDVDAFLRAPNGGAVAVFDDIGELDTGGQSRMRTTFDDLAATAFWYATMKDTQLRSENGNLANLAGADGQGTWTLELRDDTASQVGTLNGVTLILCPEAADPPTATTIFGADFEAGDQGFTHSGTADGWARGTPATVATGAIAGLDGCASGTSCWKTNLTGSYAPSSESVLVSPPIDLTG